MNAALALVNPDTNRLHSKLSHTVTEYDRQQSSKRGYNMYALPQYLGAVQRTMAEVESGTPVRKALVANFSGRLLDRLLKAAGEATSTRAEQMENPQSRALDDAAYRQGARNGKEYAAKLMRPGVMGVIDPLGMARDKAKAGMRLRSNLDAKLSYEAGFLDGFKQNFEGGFLWTGQRNPDSTTPVPCDPASLLEEFDQNLTLTETPEFQTGTPEEQAVLLTAQAGGIAAETANPGLPNTIPASLLGRDGEPAEEKLLDAIAKPGNRSIAKMARYQQIAHDWGLYRATAKIDAWMREAGVSQSTMEFYWPKRNPIPSSEPAYYMWSLVDKQSGIRLGGRHDMGRVTHADAVEQAKQLAEDYNQIVHLTRAGGGVDEYFSPSKLPRIGNPTHYSAEAWDFARKGYRLHIREKFNTPIPGGNTVTVEKIRTNKWILSQSKNRHTAMATDMEDLAAEYEYFYDAGHLAEDSKELYGTLRQLGKKTNPGIVDQIRAGDRVTIRIYAGGAGSREGPTYREKTGRAVMRSSHGGWVLNMGGAHGTPGIADESNIVKVHKRNPEDAARDLAEEFRGSPSDGVIEEVHEEVHEHEYLAPLAVLTCIRIHTESGYQADIKFPRPGSRNEVKLASNESGDSLYFVGGDQQVDLHALHMGGAKWQKDVLVLGRVKQIEYYSAKAQDNFEGASYYHKSREGLSADGTKHVLVSKVDSVLLYSRLDCLLSLAGGQYHVDSSGVVG